MGEIRMFSREVIGVKDDNGYLLREGDIIDTSIGCDIHNHEIRGIIRYNSEAGFFEVDFPEHAITKPLSDFINDGSPLIYFGTDEKVLYEWVKDKEEIA